MPEPRFLKGSCMPHLQQPRERQGPPKFLKGGKHLRHSRRTSAILEEDVTEQDDESEDQQQSAEVADEPRRRRSRMRRHERGYNEEAQTKALECTILSAGMPLLLPVACAPCSSAVDGP